MPNNSALSSEKAFYKLLNWLRNNPGQRNEKRDMGTNFERLCVWFLENDPVWSEQFSKVELNKARDLGIDLIATHKDGSGKTAIQCKFFSEDRAIPKGEVDSFISDTPALEYAGRLFIHTGKLNAPAQETLSKNKVIVLDAHDLACADINWHDALPQRDQLPDLNQTASVREIRKPRDFQKRAIKAVHDKLWPKEEFGDLISGGKRAQLHMACGTGKTFTSLKIAEKFAEAKAKSGTSPAFVLFLAPSLGLVEQTLKSWMADKTVPLTPFVVCSDNQIGKVQVEADDGKISYVFNTLKYPATTKAENLVPQIQKALSKATSNDPALVVIFGTYQSIQVLEEAQKKYALPEIDFIICDEAHRTAGLIRELGKEDKQEAALFQRVHDNNLLKAKERLYMTATPRVYSDKVKTSSSLGELASMDDEKIFGSVVFNYSFRQAVSDGHLSDYRLLVLRVAESEARAILENGSEEDRQALEAIKTPLREKEDGERLSKAEREAITEQTAAYRRLDDVGMILGCWKALLGQEVTDQQGAAMNYKQLQRAVAFCGRIEQGRSRSLVSSKQVAEWFGNIAQSYNETNNIEGKSATAHHVDGTMDSQKREEELDWLKTDIPEGESRILTNVRCLSEGIDVPALDAVLFLSPRSSASDIIQSVGRVMRRTAGKELGYIVVPIVVPDNVQDEGIADWLDSSSGGFSILWKLAVALRAHDPQLELEANQASEEGRSKLTNLIIVNTVPKGRGKKKPAKPQSGQVSMSAKAPALPSSDEREDTQDLDTAFEEAVKVRLVSRLSSGAYWTEWARRAAEISKELEARIRRIRKTTNRREYDNARKAFSELLAAFKKTLNRGVSEEQLTGMLAQHIITEPLFKALFGGDDAQKEGDGNPLSALMNPCVQALREAGAGGTADLEADNLESFWREVEHAASTANAKGRQKLIMTFYEKFIQEAFPKEAKTVVYTPVPIVDFILRSVQHVLKESFGKGIEDENVHVLDPFTGTGTFITRLLSQDLGILTAEQVKQKYNQGIWANELLLLAYYIATINIENEYAKRVGEWRPFEGSVFADTFTLEDRDLDRLANLKGNADRIKAEATDKNIRVIFGNPPYSAGASSAGDGTENITYKGGVDDRIEETYAKYTNTTSIRQLYDSYIRSLRWASDRIGDKGIIGFVSNSGFLEAALAAGVRKCLADEFSDIYIFHLRGGIRGKSGNNAKREGGNVFDIMVGVAISILVKNPAQEEKGKIYFHDIGDYLSREKKIEKINDFFSIAGIIEADVWDKIIPDKHNDWLNQRDDGFQNFITMGDNKSDKTRTIFSIYSLGLGTNRDPWVWNFSEKILETSVFGMVKTYERERERLHSLDIGRDKEALKEALRKSPDWESSEITWPSSTEAEILRNQPLSEKDSEVRLGLYRPFTKENIVFGNRFNHRQGQLPKLFPKADSKNLVICFGMNSLSPLMSKLLPDLSLSDSRANQCFPLYHYEKQEGLFEQEADSSETYIRHDAITDVGLKHFQETYPSLKISKEDLFYYIYGLLHSPDYRQKYATSLSKELPRIPRVKKTEDFTAFMEAGRALGHLHVDYDNLEPYFALEDKEHLSIRHRDTEKETFRVEKMKFGGSGKEKDKSILLYNGNIQISGIPLEAYDYEVNGRSALEWVMDRQQVKTDKRSGITNDPNDWANETENNPRYPLELFLKVMRVAMETQKIITTLPKLNILETEKEETK